MSYCAVTSATGKKNDEREEGMLADKARALCYDQALVSWRGEGVARCEGIITQDCTGSQMG